MKKGFYRLDPQPPSLVKSFPYKRKNGPKMRIEIVCTVRMENGAAEKDDFYIKFSVCGSIAVKK